MVQIERIGYYTLNMLAPFLICFLIALFTPRSAMRAVITAAVCVRVLWFGVIQPIRMLYAISVLYNPQAASVFQVIQGNVQSSPSLSFWEIISLIKNDIDLRKSVMTTWAMSFVNALIKAGVVAVCMLAVYGVKGLFAKKNDK